MTATADVARFDSAGNLPARPSLVCQQAVELVTDYLEDALSRADGRRFEMHLTKCHGCTEYLAQIRATIAVAGRVTPDDLSERMRIEFIGFYRRWQHDRDTEDQGWSSGANRCP